MDVRGERILIFGDSLSAKSAATPAIWNVDAGSNRVSSAPGDLLASLLLEQGAEAVRTDGRVGRSAWNFWSREDAGNIVAADIAWKPTKVIVMLGTNDVGLGPAPDKDAFIAIQKAFTDAGAEVWAVGPFLTSQDDAQRQAVVDTMKSVFGMRFIDGRPLSQYATHGSDGIHYTAAGARTLALALGDKIISVMSPTTLWNTVGLGVLGIGIVVMGSWLHTRHRNKQSLLGGLDAPITLLDGKRYEGTTNALVRKGYRQIACSSGLDKKGLAECWTKGGLAGEAPVPLKPRARAKRIKELEAEIQTLYSRGSYAGITPEASAKVEADIKATRAKIERLKTTGLEGSSRAPRTGPNAAIDSRAEHAWMKIESANSLHPGAFTKEYEAARARVKSNDPWAKDWTHDEPFVLQLEKTAKSIAQRAARLRKAKAVAAADDADPLGGPEITDELERRARAAGAKGALSYVGAGAEGVTVCDETQRAYKIGRHSSLADEASWLKMAAAIPSIATHVPKFYKFDKAENVIVRECLIPSRTRKPNSDRLYKLHERLTATMAPYGHGRPEFKTDSYVYTRRGPVLVDAGFAIKRGRPLAQEATELLKRTDIDPQDARDMGFALRMERGGTVPPAIADRLLKRLHAREPSVDLNGPPVLDVPRFYDEDEDGPDAPAWGTKAWQAKADASRVARKAPLRTLLAKHDAVWLNGKYRRVLAIKSAEMVDVDQGTIRVSEFDEDGPRR